MCEWSEPSDLFRAEGGDVVLTFDPDGRSMDKLEGGENKERV